MYYLLTKYGTTIGIIIRNAFIKNKTTDTSWSGSSRHCVMRYFKNDFSRAVPNNKAPYTGNSVVLIHD